MKNRFLQKILSLLLATILLGSVGCGDHKHDFIKQTVPATCETAGYDLYTCSCGEKYLKEIVEALGHEFTNYVSDDNATLNADGTKTAKCNRSGCDFTDTVIDEGSKITREQKVTLVYNNGQLENSFSVEYGKTFSTPQSPYKKNFVFSGWYDEHGKEYDFSKPVTDDITLSAKYSIDAVSITNEITTDKIKSVVKIYNKCYNKNFLGAEKDVVSGMGSGFCFKIQNGNYYVLTNCHVAYKESDREYQDLIIEDYLGNTYEGYLYSNSDKKGDAIAASYDLACIYFKSTTTNVVELPFASANPEQEDDVIALGAPKGQKNAITFGKVEKYKVVTLSETPTYESNVKFEVVCSTAICNNGSSGGPMLNAELQVVGVVYAGQKVGDVPKISYAIPLLKVKEFLNAYVYS